MPTAFVTGGSGFLGGRMIVYLRERGWSVKALARSDGAAKKIEALGATAARGDLDDEQALATGMAGCEVVFHAAAYVEEWGPLADYIKANVDGTRHVILAAKAAGVRRTVHVSTEAIFSALPSMANLDETTPLPPRALGQYGETKLRAERAVGELVAAGHDVVIVRPRLIWGKGDTSLLPRIADRVRAGKFAWVGGGHYQTSTCHVDNVCEGMLCAAERGKAGEAYFLTDGAPVEMRTFLGKLIETQGVRSPTTEVPRWAAKAAALVLEPLWLLVGAKSAPPAAKMAVALIGQDVVVRDEKARRDLGYTSKKSIAEGLAELG